VIDLERIRKLWIDERPSFERFSAIVGERLQRAVRSAGIPGTVTWRAKDIDSLIKKLLRKADHTYEGLSDKAGVRVVVRFQRQVADVLELVRTLFWCGPAERTEERLAPDQVGYHSTHVDVTLLPGDTEHAHCPAAKYHAELQVRTLAQNLWSEMAHDTIYKGGETIRRDLRRRINILSGLIELADNEFSSVEKELASEPGAPELWVLQALERQYYKLTARRSDPQLSLEVIRLLVPLYTQRPETWDVHFEAFFMQREAFLRSVFEQQQESPDRSIFLFQPEVLMIYEQLQANPWALRAKWSEQFPDSELQTLAITLGHPL
jgi:ppGpp synthetase/RelA/SpoT-type nucleotidyltranferase